MRILLIGVITVQTVASVTAQPARGALTEKRNPTPRAAQLLAVTAGHRVSTIVKLPFRTPPLGGVLGRTVPQAAAILSAAAASGILATKVTGEDVSPR